MSHQSFMTNLQTKSFLDPQSACAHPAQTGHVANLSNSTFTKQSHRNASPVQEGLPVTSVSHCLGDLSHVSKNCNPIIIHC